MIFQIALQVLVQSFIQFYYNDEILSFLFLVNFLNWKKLVEKKNTFFAVLVSMKVAKNYATRISEIIVSF